MGGSGYTIDRSRRVALLARAASLAKRAQDSWRDVCLDLLAVGQRWSRLPNYKSCSSSPHQMGNLCGGAASVAPTGIFTAGDLDDISHQLELFFERVVPRTWDKTLKVWDVATGECVATLEGHSLGVRCGVRCTFVMIWLRRRSLVLPCCRTGGASCLRRGTRRSSSGG